MGDSGRAKTCMRKTDLSPQCSREKRRRFLRCCLFCDKNKCARERMDGATVCLNLVWVWLKKWVCEPYSLQCPIFPLDTLPYLSHNWLLQPRGFLRNVHLDTSCLRPR